MSERDTWRQLARDFLSLYCNYFIDDQSLKDLIHLTRQLWSEMAGYLEEASLKIMIIRSGLRGYF